jgi:hypothetical protein
MGGSSRARIVWKRYLEQLLHVAQVTHDLGRGPRVGGGPPRQLRRRSATERGFDLSRCPLERLQVPHDADGIVTTLDQGAPP